MWQYYTAHAQTDHSTLSAVNRSNLSVCLAIDKTLKPTEHDLMTAFATSQTNDTITVREYAAQHDISEHYLWATIRRILRMTAIKRGLWDDLNNNADTKRELSKYQNQNADAEIRTENKAESKTYAPNDLNNKNIIYELFKTFNNPPESRE